MVLTLPYRKAFPDNLMEEIPAELILNWDQTGIRLVPASSSTMEKE